MASALILIRATPWAVAAVVLVSFTQRTLSLLFEHRRQFRTAVLVHLGIAVGLAVIAVVLGGGYFWPQVHWVAPAVPV